MTYHKLGLDRYLYIHVCTTKWRKNVQNQESSSTRRRGNSDSIHVVDQATPELILPPLEVAVEAVEALHQVVVA